MLRGMTATARPTWTPNQVAARERIIEAAADLIGRHGLAMCTIRGVAEESGLKKSTVLYYFDDANELVDLSVAELFGRFAAQAAEAVHQTIGAAAALEFLVRLFMGRADTPPPFRDGGLWPEYVAHALKRDAHQRIHEELETFRAVFELALQRSDLDEEQVRGRSGAAHDLLLGAMVRNMVRPIPPAEIAHAVSAITGIDLDPDRC
jgi:AcrR family transcriptional regulator